MNSEQIEQAVEVLGNGGVVVFPTDTVWGVGAAVSSKTGVQRLYEIKRREREKPTAVLVADKEMASKYGEISGGTEELIKRFWPGALTIIVKAKAKIIPKEVLGKDSTVGLRAPNHELAQQLIKLLGEGIVTTSANFGGERAPKQKYEIDPKFERLVDLLVEGKAGGGEASTVVKVIGNSIEVVRQGNLMVDLGR